MSYDIWLELDAGGPEPIRLDEDWNYTSNVSAMWRKAMPETDGLAGLDGEMARTTATVLRAGIARMEADPPAYEAMNPANGWGSFVSQLDALRRLLDQCERAPRAVVRVSR